jgi:hypothetical protein
VVVSLSLSLVDREIDFSKNNSLWECVQASWLFERLRDERSSAMW